MRPSTQVAVSGVSFGILIGAVVSVLPLPINIVAAAIVATLWIALRRRRRAQFTLPAVAIGAGVAIITVFVAIRVPVKQLDGVVPPLEYERMSLIELCDSLSRDHQVFVSPDASARAKTVTAFTTDRPMKRRQVLQKLAQDTGTHLDILYCGTGATVLFGAHPSFTRLSRAERPPKA